MAFQFKRREKKSTLLPRLLGNFIIIYFHCEDESSDELESPTLPPTVKPSLNYDTTGIQIHVHNDHKYVRSDHKDHIGKDHLVTKHVEVPLDADQGCMCKKRQRRTCAWGTKKYLLISLAW